MYSHIIVTSPNEKLARSYEHQIRLAQREHLLSPCVDIFVVSDPEGIRIGSGGGTLNALHHLKNNKLVDIASSKVLIVHSGGDSRRAPLQSVLGKAWTALNSHRHSRGANPFVLLVDELNKLTRYLRPGSVVVCCSDVLLKIGNLSDQIVFPQDSVTILSIIDSVSMAPNHGVLVTESPSPAAHCFAADNYLQKPSYDDLLANDAIILCGSTPSVLIDSGVVCFSDAAALALYSLLDSPTIASMLHPPYELRIELYSEMLLCLTVSDEIDFAQYSARLTTPSSSSLYIAALRDIYATLHSYRLYGVHIPQTHFYHLGTSEELYALQVSPVTCPTDKLAYFRDHYRLATCISSRVCNELVCNENIILRSIVEDNIRIGTYNVIENCILSGACVIGDGCILSHIDDKFGADLIVKSNVMLQQLRVSQGWVIVALGRNDDTKKVLSDEVDICVCGYSLKRMIQTYNIGMEELWPLSTTERSLWTACLFPVVPLDQNCKPLSLSWWLCDDANSSLIDVWRCSRRLSMADLLQQTNAGHMMLWQRCLSIMTSDLCSKDDAMTVLPLYRQIEYIFSLHFVDTKDNSINRWIIISWVLYLCGCEDVDIIREMKREQALLEKPHEFLNSVKNLMILNQYDAECVFDMMLRLCEGSTRVVLSLSRCMNCISSRYYARYFLLLGRFERLNLIKPDQSCVEMILHKTSTADANDLQQLLFSFMEKNWLLNDFNECNRRSQSILCEMIKQEIVQSQLRTSYNGKFARDVLIGNKIDGGREIIIESPVRVDLSGGWSDTPPICFEQVAAVINVAVNVDGRPPIRVTAKFIPTLELRLVHCKVTSDAFLNGLQIYDREECIFDGNRALSGNCVLLKACLVVLDVAPSHLNTVEEWLQLTYSSGIEIVTESYIPAGSGLGGSSVLAAAVLAAINKLLVLRLCENDIIQLVGIVEQLMTTGGGWQDQVGSMYGGFKLARSNGNVPMELSVDRITVRDDFIAMFDARCCLVYTGVQRLAKDTLVRVLNRYACHPPMLHGTVHSLIRSALELCDVFSAKSSVHEAIDMIGAYTSTYWNDKKDIAEGADTPVIRKLFEATNNLICGGSACGAGAGGFVFLVLQKHASVDDIKQVIRKVQGLEKCSVHTCNVNCCGIPV